VRICDPHNLEDVAAVAQPALMALAVKVGAARLIDNALLTPN
jgi:pantothenate synthetase